MQRFFAQHQMGSRLALNGRKRPEMREPLVRATLRCQLCGRPIGDLVGYLSKPLEEARFIPLPGGSLPHTVKGVMRCARCHGQLHLDDLEPLLRGVTLAEVGGQTVAKVLATANGREHPTAA